MRNAHFSFGALGAPSRVREPFSVGDHSERYHEHRPLPPNRSARGATSSGRSGRPSSDSYQDIGRRRTQVLRRVRGVEVEALPMDEAVRRYGESDERSTAAALHLTC